jgi:putative colanic acid biosynthesis acetyltransferase WcaF
LDAKVLPGVTIGECSVVSAGEILRKSLPDYSILVGGQVRQINPPK